MITALFSIVWFILTVTYAFLFGGFTLEPIALALWIAAVVLAFASTFALLLIFMSLYGRFQKGDQTKNMRNHKVVNSIMRFVIRALRLKIHASGLENIPQNEPFVMVGNHQTNYDIIAVKPFVPEQPLIFVAKKSLFRWPVLGRLVGILGNVPIDRLTDRSAIEAIIKAIKQYKRDVPVVIYPEGTRSKSNTMRDFKPGAFKLATKPKAPILVTTIYNFCNTWKGWPFLRQHVYIHFHPVMRYEDYGHMNTQELSRHVRAMIEKQIEHFREIDSK